MIESLPQIHRLVKFPQLIILNLPADSLNAQISSLRVSHGATLHDMQSSGVCFFNHLSLQLDGGTFIMLFTPELGRMLSSNGELAHTLIYV